MDQSLSCGVGQIVCASSCVDPGTDRMYCGASNTCTGADGGEECASNELCIAGNCQPVAPPAANLSITVDNGSATVTRGSTTTYTVVISNAGPADVTGATVSDVAPSTLEDITWSCAPSIGSSCPASGTGGLAATVDVLATGSATFSVTGTIAAAASGGLAYSGIVNAPSGVVDPDTANNLAIDIDDFAPRTDISILVASPTVANAGELLTLNIYVFNAGPDDAAAVTISDTFPAELGTVVSWACETAAGSSCVAGATTLSLNGVGDLAQTVSVAAGGHVRFAATGTVPPSATGSVVNTVTSTCATDPVPGNDSFTSVLPIQ